MSLEGSVVYFNPRGEAKFLTEHLIPEVIKIVKHEPMFASKHRKIYDGPTDFSTKKRIIRKKKNDDQKPLHLEVLNAQKIQISWATREIFHS